MQFATTDLYSLTASVTKAEATYTYDLPPIRHHKGVMVFISNTAETGTSTLDAKLQYKNPTSLAWTDLPGATFVQFADGATGERFIQVYPGSTGSDADASLTLSTNFKLISMYAPRWLRLAVTVGGTSVTRTYSADALLLP